MDISPGTAREEAERLVAAVLAAATLAANANPHIATGSAECCICPLCKVIAAVLITAATSWTNYIGVRTGARVNNITGAIKLVMLAGLAVVGPLLGAGSLSNLTPMLPDFGAVPLSHIGLALSPVLFSYLGWNATVYVGSEIHDPGRTIPRSLFAGLAIFAAALAAGYMLRMFGLVFFGPFNPRWFDLRDLRPLEVVSGLTLLTAIVAMGVWWAPFTDRVAASVTHLPGVV